MRVTKKHGAHYLQHSFRKQGKIVTKEKYLGKHVPKAIENIKEIFLRECRKEAFYDTFDSIRTAYREEWQKYPSSIKEKILQELSIDFTYNTNAIEGSTITLEETRELLEKEIAPNKPLRDVKEAEQHAKLFREILSKEISLTQKTLLDWHAKLFTETKPDIAGSLREYRVRVGPYVAPDWQDLPELLKEFFIYVKKSKELHAIERAARIHYRFEKIHPFGDGNGRIGRLITNYVLWKEKYPLLIIEYKKRKSYYNALKKDEDAFVQYFIRRYFAVHKKYLR
ncbi:Fic family protein [Candidatus Woesearchaeota archaeon]|nr:Fic family protein [Candidatus Woesearchaeota archaeon]